LMKNVRSETLRQENRFLADQAARLRITAK
jgi:hypothetical protein